VVLGGLAGPTEAGVHRAQVVQRAGLAGLVAGAPIPDQRLIVVLGSRLVPAHPHLDHAQTVQRAGLAVQVACLPEQAQGLQLMHNPQVPDHASGVSRTSMPAATSPQGSG